MRLDGLEPDRKMFYSNVEAWFYETDEPAILVELIKKRVKVQEHSANPHCLKWDRKGKIHWFIVEESHAKRVHAEAGADVE